MTIQEPILTNQQQYRRDLARYPRLSAEEQRLLEERAREGDAQARERIVFECMHFVQRVASLYTRTYMRSDDYLDLIQVGNLSLLEHVDKTFDTGKNTAYLCAIARREMRYELAYRSSIIMFPMNAAVPREQPKFLSIEELREADDETWRRVDEMISQMERPEVTSTLYGPLQEALATLTPGTREVVVRHHGIDGITETIIDISRDLQINANAAYARYYKALQRLRARLKQA